VKRFVSLQFLNSKTVGRNPWTGDQPVARPLPTQDNANRINANIHALNGIRTHDPSVRASEDSSCLRPRSHCDRHMFISMSIKFTIEILFVIPIYFLLLPLLPYLFTTFGCTYVTFSQIQ
jgi:hypothetical protein